MRAVLRFDDVNRLIVGGVESYTFIVARRIGDGEDALEPSVDVSAMVASGEMAEDVLRTHLRRGYVVARPRSLEGAGADLLRRSSESPDVLRRALSVSGVPTAPGLPRRALSSARAVLVGGKRKRAPNG